MKAWWKLSCLSTGVKLPTSVCVLMTTSRMVGSAEALFLCQQMRSLELLYNVLVVLWWLDCPVVRVLGAGCSSLLYHRLLLWLLAMHFMSDLSDSRSVKQGIMLPNIAGDVRFNASFIKCSVIFRQKGLWKCKLLQNIYSSEWKRSMTVNAGKTAHKGIWRGEYSCFWIVNFSDLVDG